MNIKIIKLDINKPIYEKIQAKQGDTKSRYLLFHLLDGAIPFSLNGRTVRVYGLKPDNKEIFNDLQIVDATRGICKLELTSQALAVPGNLDLELVIMEGESKLSSIPFVVEVLKSLNSKSAIESSNEYKALDRSLIEVEAWNKEFAEKSGKLEELYTPRLNEVSSQLAEKANNNMVKSTIAPSIKKKKSIITIVDDDWGIGVYSKLAPEFISRNLPCCVGIITDRLGDSKYPTLEQAKELQDIHGWEICSHTQSHKAVDDNLTDEQLEYEIKGSMDKLNSLGLQCENMIYPFGSPSQRGRAYTRKFYTCGANAETGKINYSPVKTFNLDRVALGSYTYSGKDTLSYYKSKIDECKNNGGWLIFMTHIDNTDNTQFEYLKQTLDYIVTSGVEVVTLKEGLSIYGNNAEIGEFTDKSQKNFAVFDNENNLYADNLRHYFKEPMGITSVTPITDFEIGVTVTAFNASNSGNGLPGTMGTLITYRPHKTTNDLGFQMWYRLDTNDAQMRKWIGSNWGNFININNSKNIVLGNNALNLNDIEAVRVGYVTTTYITDSFARTNGFPDNIGGELKIIKLNGEYNFWYSEYRPRNSQKVYMRWASSSVQWGAFSLISTNYLKANASNLIGSLATGVSKDVNFAVTGFRFGDCVVAYPNVILPAGVMFNVYYKQDDVATLRVMNLSGSTLDLGTIDWKLFVIKC